MIRLLIPIIALLLFAAEGLAVEMTSHRPDEVFMNEGERLYTYDGAGVSQEEAHEVADYFFKTYGVGKFPSIYKLPGMEHYYVVSAIGYQGERDPSERGRRFFLIRKDDKRLRLIQTTKGAGDSLTLDPTFYHRDGDVFILAEVGAEECWGFSVFRFDPEKKALRSLGMLEVGSPARMYNEISSPIEFLRVYRNKGGYRIEIAGDIILNPGKKGARQLAYRGKSFVFLHDGHQFTLQEEVGKKK